MPKGITERISMNLNRSFGLALALACVAQATVSQTALEPKESPAQLRARLQQKTSQTLSPENPGYGKSGPVVMAAPAAHPANPVAAPSKEERLANWRDLPALEAYRLFKELGRELPTELALQVNASMTVNVYNESLRQAGGSPMTAVPIPYTNPGDSYSDSGNTIVLSNYLSNVPYNYNNNSCINTYGFYGNDAWYTFTLYAPTQVSADLCSGGYNYDTLLGIFNTSLDMVASNDDACGILQSSLSCCLEAGTYFVVVDGFGGSAGTYTLDVGFNNCPASPTPTRGGADAFGYTWTITGDSQDTPFEWQDISTIGTAVTLGDDDYTITPIAIPFAFPFYGLDYNQVYIGSNGLVGFDPLGLWSFGNTGLPNSGSPNALIAAFWDDLLPGGGGTIHYLSDPYYGRLYIQYTGVPAFGDGGLYTFQIVLNKGGDVVIHYLDMQDDDLSQATVGIENPDGTDGLTANFDGNGAAIGDLKTVHFHYPSATSGSDLAGYSWTTSNAPNGPAFGFYDISWATDLNISFDDTYVAQALPFAFPFYGVDYSTVYVTSNGLLSFSENGNSSFGNDALPSAVFPNNMICAFWDDLDPGFGGTVRYLDESYQNRVIFQWNAVAHNGDYITNNYVSHFTFQAILYRDGTIDLNYRDMSGYYTGSATVGLENADGTIGLLATFEGSGASTMDGTTIRFRTPQPRPTRGGPSAGYEWANSLDPAGPEYLFTDISGTGINLGLSGDDQTVVTSLPFAFPWFGGLHDQVSVCSNGWISFDTGAVAYFSNEFIPYAFSVNNMICAFWDDLYLPFGGQVYYQDDSANGRVIFQWNQVPHISGTDGPYTFQVMLYTNGEIYLNYGDMGATVFYGVTSATVGVENADGSAGLQVNAFNAGGLIANGVTVAIAPVYRKPAAITDLRIVQDAVTNGQPFLYHYEWSPVTTDINGNYPVRGILRLLLHLRPEPLCPVPLGLVLLGGFTRTEHANRLPLHRRLRRAHRRRGQ
jgi:hypothetical protein